MTFTGLTSPPRPLMSDAAHRLIIRYIYTYLKSLQAR
jgi:hypothetical protein